MGIIFEELIRKFIERKQNADSTPDSLERMEAVLRDHGVVVFASPAPGARLKTTLV
jgi:hypothetical protein